MNTEITPFDVAEHLDREDQEELLAEAAASGDANAIAKAEEIVSRARGLAETAEESRPRSA